jgi:hypothetical protein
MVGSREHRRPGGRTRRWHRKLTKCQSILKKKGIARLTAEDPNDWNLNVASSLVDVACSFSVLIHGGCDSPGMSSARISYSDRLFCYRPQSKHDNHPSRTDEEETSPSSGIHKGSSSDSSDERDRGLPNVEAQLLA